LVTETTASREAWAVVSVYNRIAKIIIREITLFFAFRCKKKKLNFREDNFMNILGDIVWNEDSIYDILNAIIDTDLLKEVAESHMEFENNTTNIILYTTLSITNTNLLKQGKYNKPINAFEYYESVLGGQSDYIIQLSYNTQGLYDTLHPRAYKEIEDIIKKNGLKKSELEDMQIIRHLLKTHTGVRVHSFNPSKKCYTKTHMLFENSRLAYILNPNAVKILNITQK